MEEIIYHGSDHIIEKPQYGYGKRYNDYGMGFYCTQSLALAKEWGSGMDRNGYANEYKIDCDGLRILHLNSPQYNMLHWLTILLQNRTFEAPSPLAEEAKEYLLANFSIDYESFDIIIGYRADDSYFSFASDFINGTISYRQLSNAMRLGKLGEQFVLKSPRAFDRLQFVKYETAQAEEWFARKKQRDTEARSQYFNLERNRRQKGDLYIIHILEERMMPDDPRLR